MENYKKFSLYTILDCYVTKNAIEDFLTTDWSEYKKQLYSEKNNKEKINLKIINFINYLKNELDDIEKFLSDDKNFHWDILEKDRSFFDELLPTHKRKIEWFRSVDRYPFDHGVFFSSSETLKKNEAVK